MALLNSVLDHLEDTYGLNPTDDALYESFTSWAREKGTPLYEHQDEALLEAIDGKHLIVSTPTGSGKSMIALAGIFTALAHGKTAYYTAPLKALVSEKFFDLIETFGADNVGLQTGDSSINLDAPIMCATAEVVANIALRDGIDASIDVLIADEFHFYADKERGWAWQVPLLELENTQHILLSATLGDTHTLEKDLVERTGRKCAHIHQAQRPIPLTYRYCVQSTPLLAQELCDIKRTPAYFVHFSQKDAVNSANDLLSLSLISKEQKEAIVKEINDFPFSTHFGKQLSKLLRNGIAVHHAGLLPRYRRLVERLAARGLLAIICGTDTLGVGINVPISTVVFTALSKYDGERSRHLTAREFHQIAGRAGRAGFDTVGDVIVQAPEYEIANALLIQKAQNNPDKLKKIRKKKAPSGVVLWSEKTLEHLQKAEPEKLQSQIFLTHGMVLSILQRGCGKEPIDDLISKSHGDNHEVLRQQMKEILDSLEQAGIIEVDNEHIDLVHHVPLDFALNQPLAPFALAAFELFDSSVPDYALHIVSVVESILENPYPILYAQEKEEKNRTLASLRENGMSYEQRMNMIDNVTYPMPLKDELEAALSTYRQTNPWAHDFALHPKSIIREMVETSATFSDIVSRYSVARNEGVLLRYLSNAYKVLTQTVPEHIKTEELVSITQWLGDMVRSIDSSLLDEWESLRQGSSTISNVQTTGQEKAYGSDDEGNILLSNNLYALRKDIRNQMYRLTEYLQLENYDALDAQATPALWSDGTYWDGDAWIDATEDFFDEYDAISITTSARSDAFFHLNESPRVEDLIDAHIPEDEAYKLVTGNVWLARQVFDDERGDHAWGFWALIDLDDVKNTNKAVIHVLYVGEFS
ncbi:MAG: DUF3516 domain-containing protein [Actinomycetaceae bacterium]|nr:DUF3516 domain-containing protein [Actinomycetaceae bacterium]